MDDTTPKPTQAAINERVLTADPNSGLGERAMRGGAIAVGAQLVRMALQIMSIAILARLLAPDQFGIVAMGATVTALIATLTEFYVSAAAIQRDKLDQDTCSGLLLMTLVGGLITFVLGCGAIPVAVWLFKEERLTWIVLGLAAAAPISALGAQHQALMTRNMRWLDLHFVNVAGLGIGVVAAVLSAWLFHAGYWALLIQTLGSAAATTALSWMLCPWRPSWPHDWTGTRESMKFGLNLTAAGILQYFHRQLDNMLVGWRWGAVELGFYSRAYNLLQTPLNFLAGPLATAMVPAMSRMQGQPDKWRAAYLDALTVITIIGAGMAAVLYGGAGAIIEVVFGHGWHETRVIFASLVISMLAATPMRTTGWIYLSNGRTDRMLRWAMVGTPMYITAFFIGLPYGAAGLALCYSISQLIAFFPCMWMATRGTNITMMDVLRVVAVPTGAAIVIGLGLERFSHDLHLVEDVAAIFVAGLIYLAIVGVAIWYLPAYSRLRARGLSLIGRLHLPINLRPGT